MFVGPNTEIQLPAPPRKAEYLDYQYLETGFAATSETADRYGKKAGNISAADVAVCSRIKISMILGILINSFPGVYLFPETFSKFNGLKRPTATN
jgi:hypothetical protein